MYKNTDLVAYAKKQIGLPYWYGTFGQIASNSLFIQKRSQYPKYYRATDFKSQYGKRVHDCCGLIKGILMRSKDGTLTYNATYDKNAKGFYTSATEKGTISSLPKKEGILVFKGLTVSTIHHVGVLCKMSNKWVVIEAKGHEFGVLATTFKASEWNFWAQCIYLSSDQKHIVYTVQKSDTLSAIAKKHKTTVKAIAEANKIKDVNLIYIGQHLTIYV